VSSDTAETIRTMVREAVVEALGQPVTIANDVSAPIPAGSSEPPGPASPREYYSPWTGTAYEAHPSQRRLVDIGIAPPIWQTAAGQPCPLEPRSCDDCGKCRALGF
jgi:hypothetical protein